MNREYDKTFDELTEEQKERGIENYKEERMYNQSPDDEELEEYKNRTDEEWHKCASGYSYHITEYDDGSYSVWCNF